MEIREYKSDDCEKLAKLFYDTVHTVNIGDYTKEEADAWADGEPCLAEWNKSFLEHYTLIAVQDGVIIGFGDIDNTGYLDRLYVHKDYQKKGAATLLCDKLEAFAAGKKIITHASITAKPFFEKRGYCELKIQKVERAGQYLTNYVMEK